ncbi:aspartic peptidase domain-containing protein [Talaromyces proteolyticus]|uniref:Aspartic peptidase domain-containing protein n=1 Tax=Talaromyces proteolyticus TaxID=1131652 RepID=A0AAD4PUC4_9EURO|nr:aspartic peptidase domain-containing protein [Talaromyces proteolyticus]KAH8694946.1 aspartic peptidase domain-containing protein [Talaromyces proteolyticus]
MVATAFLTLFIATLVASLNPLAVRDATDTSSTVNPPDCICTCSYPQGLPLSSLTATLTRTGAGLCVTPNPGIPATFTSMRVLVTPSGATLGALSGTLSAVVWTKTFKSIRDNTIDDTYYNFESKFGSYVNTIDNTYYNSESKFCSYVNTIVGTIVNTIINTIVKTIVKTIVSAIRYNTVDNTYHNSESKLGPYVNTIVKAVVKAIVNTRAKKYRDDPKYNIPVEIGGQTFHLQLDTFAPDTIVYTVQPDITYTSVTLYNPPHGQQPEPMSWIWNAQKFEIDGSPVGGGAMIRDNITIQDGPVSLNQTLLVGDGNGGLPEGIDHDRPWDGVLALTRQNATLRETEGRPIPSSSWFDNILPQLRDPVIGICLRSQSPGFIDLGKVNEAYTDHIRWAVSKTATEGFWTFHVSSYSIEKKPPVPCDMQIALNTGSKYTTLDSSLVDSFRGWVAHQMGVGDLGEDIYYDCAFTLPTVTLTIDQVGGGTFLLDLPSSAFSLADNINSEHRNCEFALRKADGGLDIDLKKGMTALGISALNTLYVVLNASTSDGAVGFAPQ